jgi:coenzyme F420-reducing hydrogenase gamma subunit
MKKKKYGKPAAAIARVATEAMMVGSCAVIGGTPNYYEYEDQAEMSQDIYVI